MGGRGDPVKGWGSSSAPRNTLRYGSARGAHSSKVILVRVIYIILVADGGRERDVLEVADSFQ